METNAKKFECDRCHKIAYVDNYGYEEYDKKALPVSWSQFSIREGTSHKTYQLCYECTTEHNNWLRQEE